MALDRSFKIHFSSPLRVSNYKPALPESMVFGFKILLSERSRQLIYCFFKALQKRTLYGGNTGSFFYVYQLIILTNLSQPTLL